MDVQSVVNDQRSISRTSGDLTESPVLSDSMSPQIILNSFGCAATEPRPQISLSDAGEPHLPDTTYLFNGHATNIERPLKSLVLSSPLNVALYFPLLIH